MGVSWRKATKKERLELVPHWSCTAYIVHWIKKITKVWWKPVYWTHTDFVIWLIFFSVFNARKLNRFSAKINIFSTVEQCHCGLLILNHILSEHTIQLCVCFALWTLTFLNRRLCESMTLFLSISLIVMWGDCEHQSSSSVLDDSNPRDERRMNLDWIVHSTHRVPIEA